MKIKCRSGRDTQPLFSFDNCSDTRSKWRLFQLPPNSAKFDGCARKYRIFQDFCIPAICVTSKIPHDEDIQSNNVGTDEDPVVEVGGGEAVGIAEIVEEELVDDQVRKRDYHGETERTEKNTAVFGVLVEVDPFEKTDNEAGECEDAGNGQVKLYGCEVAVERVVESRVGAASDEETDPCEVKSKQESEGFWMRDDLLRDRG